MSFINLEDNSWLAYVATGLAGLGLWVRRERSAWAASNKVVAEAEAETVSAQSKTDMLKAMRDELDELRKQVIVLANRVAVLEATLISVNQHYTNLILCDGCKTTNGITLKALDSALDKALPEGK